MLLCRIFAEQLGFVIVDQICFSHIILKLKKAFEQVFKQQNIDKKFCKRAKKEAGFVHRYWKCLQAGCLLNFEYFDNLQTDWTHASADAQLYFFRYPELR
jgi:hypothetical protein